MDILFNLFIQTSTSIIMFLWCAQYSNRMKADGQWMESRVHNEILYFDVNWLIWCFIEMFHSVSAL